MANKYLIAGVVLFFFLTSLIYIGFNNRYTYHQVDDLRGEAECMVRINNYTGSACIVVGKFCAISKNRVDTPDLDRCFLSSD